MYIPRYILIIIIAVVAAAVPFPLLKAYEATNNSFYLFFSVATVIIFVVAYIITLREYNII